MYSFLLAVGGLSAIILILRRNKINPKKLRNGLAVSLILIVVGLLGSLLGGASVADMAHRASSAQFNAEGYAAVRIAKEHFPAAKKIIVVGIGDLHEGVLDYIKSSGYPDAVYIKLFDGPPFGASEAEIKANLEYVCANDAFKKADIIVSKYSFPRYASKIFSPGQKVIYFGSSPDAQLWESGVIAVQAAVKSDVKTTSYPDNPKKFFEKVYDIKINSVK